MKIPKKYSMPIFILLTSIFMSFLMAFVVTLVNLGLTPDFMIRWFKAWGFSFIISLPIVSVVIPTVRKIVDKATE